MKTETPKQRERRLNETLSDCYSEEQALENFIYLTNQARGRGNTTTERNIRHCHANRMLGTLLRRLDPTAFYCS